MRRAVLTVLRHLTIRCRSSDYTPTLTWANVVFTHSGAALGPQADHSHLNSWGFHVAGFAPSISTGARNAATSSAAAVLVAYVSR